MKTILRLLLVGLAIYVFLLMISSINFIGMSFDEIRLIISVCLGVAVCFISQNAGQKIIYSAMYGFITGIITNALILWFIQAIKLL